MRDQERLRRLDQWLEVAERRNRDGTEIEEGVARAIEGMGEEEGLVLRLGDAQTVVDGILDLQDLVLHRRRRAVLGRELAEDIDEAEARQAQASELRRRKSADIGDRS